MAFKGLFIGIDRYASTEINWLSCASRDARALHALFTDTLGGETALLTDEQATMAAIEDRFGQLAACSADDVVVVAFSGHGTETHELVGFDTNPRDLTRTTIPLARLGEWCARIPSRRLLIVLDCCFSGGMGAKALHVEGVPRDMQSVDGKLNQISGEGRVVLTASGPTERAWESARLGHGFLTLHLLEALRGPAGLREGERIGVLRLLDYVVRRVVDAAQQIRREQHPAVRGTFDGEFTWPVLTPGPIYRAAFPDRGNAVATAEITSLAAFGFPQAVIDAWAGDIPRLNQLQLDAINDFGILRGDHVVASAPTSSGKTMLGELAAIRGALDGQRALFLMPLKALVNDKLRQFQRVYGAFGIRTIEATGETADITPLLRGHYDIALLTYEKFAAIALTHPHVVEQVGTIVIDELQMIADQSRGANLEFLLTLLRMRRRDGSEPQVIALSAVIGDTNGLERWLGGRLLRRVERPVPLDEGALCCDGRFRYLDGDTGGFLERMQPAFDALVNVLPVLAKANAHKRIEDAEQRQRHLATQLSDKKAMHLKLIEAKLRGELKQEDFDAMRDVLTKDIAEIESAHRAMIQDAEAALLLTADTTRTTIPAKGLWASEQLTDKLTVQSALFPKAFCTVLILDSLNHQMIGCLPLYSDYLSSLQSILKLTKRKKS